MYVMFCVSIDQVCYGKIKLLPNVSLKSYNSLNALGRLI